MVFLSKTIMAGLPHSTCLVVNFLNRYTIDSFCLVMAVIARQQLHVNSYKNDSHCAIGEARQFLHGNSYCTTVTVQQLLHDSYCTARATCMTFGIWLHLHA